MAWNGVADFIERRNRYKAEDQQTNFQQLLQAAGLAKDVWSQLQEQNKYKPGSDYMNAMHLMNVDWPTEAAGKQEETKLNYDKQWLDYQNQNPGKPAEQVLQEWYQTPAGQAALQAGYSREDAVRAADHANRMSEIAASRGANQNWMDLKDAHDLAISDAATAFHMPTDPNGNPVWDPSVNKEKVRAMLHDYAQFVDPSQKQAFISMMDNWVDATSAGAPTATAEGGKTVDLAKINATIDTLAKTVLTPTPKRGNTASLNNPNSWAQAEKNLESELTNLDANPNLTPDEKQAVELAYAESSRSGRLDDATYDQLYRFVQALKNKYAKAGAGRSAGGL